MKNVKVQEVKVLADYMSDPKISTQHGVKGESMIQLCLLQIIVDLIQ